jgi:hypothetical protein
MDSDFNLYKKVNSFYYYIVFTLIDRKNVVL